MDKWDRDVLESWLGCYENSAVGQCLRKALERLDALKVENDDLKRLRRVMAEEAARQIQGSEDSAMAIAADADAKIARLVEVLRPFAGMAQATDYYASSGNPLHVLQTGNTHVGESWRVTIADLRKAAALLKEILGDE